MGPDAIICLVLSQLFHSLPSSSSRGSLLPLHFLPLEWYHSHIWGCSLQQYVNHELLDVQVGFRKGRGTRDQIANIHWIIQKAREFQKNIYFCFIDYAKVFDCVDHNKLWKILEEMGIPDHLTCLLRNLCAGQEATVRTGHGTTVQFSRSVVSDSLQPLSITNSQSLLKFMSIESVMPSHPPLSPSPPAPNPSLHQSLFQWVSSSHEVAKVLEFQL